MASFFAAAAPFWPDPVARELLSARIAHAAGRPRIGVAADRPLAGEAEGSRHRSVGWTSVPLSVRASGPGVARCAEWSSGRSFPLRRDEMLKPARRDHSKGA